MNNFLKRLSFKHKNNRFFYYFMNIVRQLFPSKIFQSRLNIKMASLKEFEIDYIAKRVNYYNKIDDQITLSDSVKYLSDFKLKRKHKAYFFDCYEYTRFFSPFLKVAFKFGDVIKVPAEPTIVKSRPINGNNVNSVILNLGKIRHFSFIKDRKDFKSKKNMLVCRNYANQAHRIRFLEMYINHPLCNIGKINKNYGHKHLLKEIMTIEEHLAFKFILCLEGNDVATNLKWVMSSNSLAVMPKPKYETWFMEGKLIPNYHYVLINNDYTDLEERMKYYMNHTDEALEILNNAHQYIEQFKNKKREDLISLFVLEKYFNKTGQKNKSEYLNLILKS